MFAQTKMLGSCDRGIRLTLWLSLRHAGSEGRADGYVHRSAWPAHSSSCIPGPRHNSMALLHMGERQDQGDFLSGS